MNLNRETLESINQRVSKIGQACQIAHELADEVLRGKMSPQELRNQSKIIGPWMASSRDEAEKICLEIEAIIQSEYPN